jgi:SPOR domain/PilZ domain
VPDTVQSAENPGTLERRLHPRKQLLFPWIKVGIDNGGIILNISESGLAIQAVRSLADGELPAMRFQLSESQNWIETPGRIAWIDASKHMAGVEFVGLPEEARNKIRQWIPLALHPNGSAEEKPLGEKSEPVKDVLPTREPESAIVGPESAATERADEYPSRHSITEVPAGVLLSTAETRDFATVSQYSGASVHPNATTEETAPVEKIAPLVEPVSTDLEMASIASVPEPETTERAVENPEQDFIAKEPAGLPPIASDTRDLEPVWQYFPPTSRETRPPFHLSYEGTARIRGDELTSSPRNSRRWIGVLVVVSFLVLLLLLLAFAFPGIYLRHAGNDQQSREVPAAASQPALPSNDSAIPKNPPISAEPKQPLDQPSFVLQVGAMTHEKYAMALAESLEQKNFPAFVSQHENDRFYRVFVGPFSDVDSTLRVREQLKEQGFEAFRTPWNPSAQ